MYMLSLKRTSLLGCTFSYKCVRFDPLVYPITSPFVGILVNRAAITHKTSYEFLTMIDWIGSHMSQELSGVFKITFADSSPYLKIVLNLKVI
jgi:hypothetical protein